MFNLFQKKEMYIPRMAVMNNKGVRSTTKEATRTSNSIYMNL